MLVKSFSLLNLKAIEHRELVARCSGLVREIRERVGGKVNAKTKDSLNEVDRDW